MCISTWLSPLSRSHSFHLVTVNLASCHRSPIPIQPSIVVSRPSPWCKIRGFLLRPGYHHSMFTSSIRDLYREWTRIFERAAIMRGNKNGTFILANAEHEENKAVYRQIEERLRRVMWGNSWRSKASMYMFAYATVSACND